MKYVVVASVCVEIDIEANSPEEALSKADNEYNNEFRLKLAEASVIEAFQTEIDENLTHDINN